MPDDPRQGDYLPSIERLFSLDSGGNPLMRETPLGVVLMSQCCDLARTGSGDPVAAAVVALEGQAAKLATSGHQPRYAPLEWLGGDLFADFSLTGSVQHAAVVAADRTSVPSTTDRIMFAARVSRRFGRFAYPDEIQPFLTPIRSKIRSKARSENSPLGRCLKRVVTIRIENETDWDEPPPWNINLVVILADGELPTAGSAAGRGSSSVSITDLADEIVQAAPGSSGLELLWQQLADALLAEGLQAVDPTLVGSAISEVLEESEFSFARYRRSADLDVDDLSE